MSNYPLIIITAALQMEIQGLISGSGNNLRKISSWLWEGQYRRHPVRVVKTGVGKENAQRTLSKALLQCNVRCAQDCLVINIGWAGALQPYLKVGSIVAAQKICEVSQDGRRRCLSLEGDSSLLTALCAIDSVSFGTLLTISRVANIEEKQILSQQYPEALAVDMESFPIVQICHERQIPVVVLRAISDTLSFQLPGSFGGGKTAVSEQQQGKEQDQSGDQDQGKDQGQGKDQDQGGDQGQGKDQRQGKDQDQGGDQEAQSSQRIRLYHHCRQAAQANWQVLDRYLDCL